ncbi:MAG: helix-turn-helix transcriptional regulator, partial [Clostridia bacterium]|nr:helix-turn-helix transcriptional regulator [Clostridia bacterium]
MARKGRIGNLERLRGGIVTSSLTCKKSSGEKSKVYTILKRLELSGMLTVRASQHEGRLRIYYHITKEGLSR